MRISRFADMFGAIIGTRDLFKLEIKRLEKYLRSSKELDFELAQFRLEKLILIE